MDANKAVDFIIQNSQKFAHAKAERTYIENFLRSKKSILMSQSTDSTIGGQERDAYRHPEYLALIEGLKEAVEVEETLKWKLIAAQARIDIFRTLEASNRAQDRATR
jgi:hypothetical protein